MKTFQFLVTILGLSFYVKLVNAQGFGNIGDLIHSVIGDLDQGISNDKGDDDLRTSNGLGTGQAVLSSFTDLISGLRAMSNAKTILQTQQNEQTTIWTSYLDHTSIVHTATEPAVSTFTRLVSVLKAVSNDKATLQAQQNVQTTILISYLDQTFIVQTVTEPAVSTFTSLISGLKVMSHGETTLQAQQNVQTTILISNLDQTSIVQTVTLTTSSSKVYDPTVTIYVAEPPQAVYTGTLSNDADSSDNEDPS